MDLHRRTVYRFNPEPQDPSPQLYARPDHVQPLALQADDFLPLFLIKKEDSVAFFFHD